MFGLASIGLTIGNEFSEINGFNWFFLAATCFIGSTDFAVSLRLNYQNDRLKKHDALTRKEVQENYLKIARPLYKLLKTEIETNLSPNQGEEAIIKTRDHLQQLLELFYKHITSNQPLSPEDRRNNSGQRIDRVIIRELYEQLHEEIQDIERTFQENNLDPREGIGKVLNDTRVNLQNALNRYFPDYSTLRKRLSHTTLSPMHIAPNSPASNTATAFAPAVASAAAISRSREDDISPEGFYTATASEEGSNSPDI